ncbi:lpg1661 family Dot/Icm T4SS effector [soil metagenome]
MKGTAATLIEHKIEPASAKPQFKGFNHLQKQRISSIDTFRGITILVMIFVNEIAGVQNIPQWMQHMPADVDGMTFVDVVFPAFLFIVGMSIPFAIHNRLSKGDGILKLQKHIIVRTLGLLVLGVFMVNAGSGNEDAMGMPVRWWTLSFYIAAILVWNTYSFKSKNLSILFRTIGAIALIYLALIYRGGDGSEYLQPRWWGILGLIGWAYFYSCILYQLVKGSKPWLLSFILLCVGVFVLGNNELVQHVSWLQWTAAQAGNASHTAIALSGIILTLIFFDQKNIISVSRRFGESFAFASLLTITGILLWPYFPISKIYATPTYALFCIAICCIMFAFLYWLVDLKKIKEWTAFFQPAASNPLLVYIIPSIIYALFGILGWYRIPPGWNTGLFGIIYFAFYAVAIMWLVRVLNYLNIRLKL